MDVRAALRTAPVAGLVGWARASRDREIVLRLLIMTDLLHMLHLLGLLGLLGRHLNRESY